MGKKSIVKADGFALAQALSSASKTVSATRRAIRTEKKILNFKLQAERDERNLGKQMNGILRDFESYLKKADEVMKKFKNKDGVSLSNVVTPEVRDRILKPYLDFLGSKFNGANNINEVIDGLNEKRAKDLKNHGTTDDLVNDINAYYDAKIRKYVYPLRVIEAQFNSIKVLKGKRTFDKFKGISDRLIAEDTRPIEDNEEVKEESGKE